MVVPRQPYPTPPPYTLPAVLALKCPQCEYIGEKDAVTLTALKCPHCSTIDDRPDAKFCAKCGTEYRPKPKPSDFETRSVKERRIEKAKELPPLKSKPYDRDAHCWLGFGIALVVILVAMVPFLL